MVTTTTTTMGEDQFKLYQQKDYPDPQTLPRPPSTHEPKPQVTLPDLIDRYLFNPEVCFKVGWDELESIDGMPEMEVQPPKNLLYATQILGNHLHNV